MTGGPQDPRMALAAALQTSQRSSAVPAFIVMDVMQAAADREARGHRVIHMEVGQPSTPAPRAAVEAVQRALGGETLGYTMALGIPALRARIARHYAERYGVAVAPERVVVTSGSSAGFILAFLSLFEPGGGAPLANPAFPPYRPFVPAPAGDRVPIAPPGQPP